MLNKYALWKVIEVLITDKNNVKEFSVREMSRAAKIGPSTAKACLDYLHENRLIKKKVIGNIYQYSLNTKNPAARGIKNTFLAKMICDSVAKMDAANAKNARIILCSNEAETVVFTIGEKVMLHGVEGIETRQATEQEFEKIRKNYLDIITIQ